ANTTVFTLVNAVLFRGLPFPDPDRIVVVTCSQPSEGRERVQVSYPDFRDWKAQSKSFQGLAAYDFLQMSLSDRTDVPERYIGAAMTANSFSLIGAAPVLGRDFTREDEKPGTTGVAIIGYRLWENRYGRDPNILGRQVRLNEKPVTIIGVMPKGFRFPLNHDVWTTLNTTPAANPGIQKRDNRSLQVYGRLKPDVSLTDARAEMALIASQLEKSYSKENKGIKVNVKTFNDEFNGGQIRVVFLALLGAVCCVLLVACANVSNLLLARSLARAREISIRVALGASRWQIVRQLLLESVMLGFAGGALGLVLAFWGVKGFALAVADVGKPYWIDFRMDFTVFAYLTAICVGTGILFGLFPALQSSKLKPADTLKEGTRGAGGGRRAKFFTSSLVVVELALSLFLLIGAGLMIRSFYALYGMTSVLDSSKLLVMRMYLLDVKYPKPADRQQFLDRLLPRLRSLPGVEAVTAVSHFPMDGSMSWRFELDGKPPVENAKKPATDGLVIAPEYFNLIGKPLLRGREFNSSDGLPGKEVAIVNQRFAAKYFQDQDPLAKRVLLELPDRPGSPRRVWLPIVGLCANIVQNDPTKPEPDPLVYIPAQLQPLNNVGVIARIHNNPKALITAFRKEVQNLDQDLPVFSASTLDELFTQKRWGFRVFGTLFSLFAAFALILASVGLYAVMAYGVVQRTPEIGVRIALGASRANILSLVVRTGLYQFAIGLVLGLIAAFAGTRVLSSLLVRVKPSDPLTFISLTAVLFLVTMIACIVPARRAMRVDPIVALRYE
ncbi:MAG: ABC transporter permease, partial [Acidobacteriota bacterium]|nr:ABC transporter permease [Acidobacteriota bacterium]